MDLILKPYHIATSKPAQKTYLNTLLFLLSSAILLGFAVVAYLLFYYAYIPQIGVERVIHLQYGTGPHPHGTASLSTSLISSQPYDISLTLHVPRSPPNLELGNFMLSLSLLSPNHISSPSPSTTSTSEIKYEDLLFTSRRPALIPYTSPLLAHTSRLLTLPLYLLSLRTESNTLTVPMAESVSFAKGWVNVPRYVVLEVQAGQGQELQTYDVKVQFRARFGGVRWVMYRWRVLAFIFGVGGFWAIEVVGVVVGWVLVRHFFASTSSEIANGKEEEEEEVKEEQETDSEPDLSDTPRTFPTYGRQAPLRYEPKVKEEEEDSDGVLEGVEIQPLVGEADDEDEGEEEEMDDRGRDSGIGTSFSEGGERGVARRRSRGGKV